MTTLPTICLIGDIVIDVTLRSFNSDSKLRLGGIVHAARGLWALGIPYDVGYFSPSYLDDQISAYLTHHGCRNAIKLGDVTGAPNVFLIQESKEIGSQGYEFLLRDELKVQYLQEGLELIRTNSYKDHLIISGNFDLSDVVNQLGNSIHIDVANNVASLDIFEHFDRKIDTLFLSTSSDIFKSQFSKDFISFATLFEKYAGRVILKENRGGSRGYNFKERKLFGTGAQQRKIAHSVGVGDVFDATYISANFERDSEEKKIALASWIAAEYACTSFPDDLKRGIGRVLKSNIEELMSMPSISVPWERRNGLNVYIAAPDFASVNTAPIDLLADALVYHSFLPRRPVRENGEMNEFDTKERKATLVKRDLEILGESFLMIAVMIYNDPGTLIEIGYAKAKGMPVIVYDPFGAATNCMLTELPDMISSDLDEIISETFMYASKYLANGK